MSTVGAAADRTLRWQDRFAVRTALVLMLPLPHIGSAAISGTSSMATSHFNVTITPCRGQVTVPSSVVGQSQPVVEQILSDLGLHSRRDGDEQTAQVPEYDVASTGPVPPGALADCGTVVRLTIATAVVYAAGIPTPSRRVTVPKGIVGLTVRESTAILKRLGVRVAIGRAETSVTIPPGRTLWSLPAPLAVIARGATVELIPAAEPPS
jgi:hypothetical protein